MYYVPSGWGHDEDPELMRHFQNFDFEELLRMGGRYYWHTPMESLVQDPHYMEMCEIGEDTMFAALNAMLSDGQRDAICSYLGRWMEAVSPRAAYEPAQILHWSWGTYKHDAVELSNRYYDRLRNHTYPLEDAEANIGAILPFVREIEECFRDVPKPEQNNIVAKPGIDIPDSMAALELPAFTWQNIHPVVLSYVGEMTNNFAPGAFRYFLPAFLIQDLYLQAGLEVSNGIEFWTNHDVNWPLTYPFYKPPPKRSWLKSFKVQMSELSLSERECVVKFLNFHIDFIGQDWEKDSTVQLALDQYWMPSLKEKRSRRHLNG